MTMPNAGTSLMLREIGEAGEVVARMLAANAQASRQFAQRVRDARPERRRDYRARQFRSLRALSQISHRDRAWHALRLDRPFDRLALSTRRCGSTARSRCRSRNPAAAPTLSRCRRRPSAAGALTLALGQRRDPRRSPTDADCLLPLACGPGEFGRRDQIDDRRRSSPARPGRRLARRRRAWPRASPDCPSGLLGADRAAAAARWSNASPRQSPAFVLGRGATFAIAAEAALKLKETCAIHAEAFSSAEVMHGPAAIVAPGFLVLAFMPQDEARDGMMRGAGATSRAWART